MRFRGIALVLGILGLTATVCAQNSGSEDLPSAPSAVQQRRSRPKPPPPAAPAPKPELQATEASASAPAQTAPGRPSADQSTQNQAPQTRQAPMRNSAGAAANSIAQCVHRM